MVRLIKISNSSLNKLYTKRRLSTYRISKRIGCSQATIWKRLKRFKIKKVCLNHDNRKGKRSSQGYLYNSNYYTLRVNSKKDLMNLLTEISSFIKHSLKIKALKKAKDNIIQRNNRSINHGS